MQKLEMFETLIGMMVPSVYLLDFEVVNVADKGSIWELELREKSERIPSELIGKEVVLDGYTNPRRIQSHCFSIKPVSLLLYRRRWKESGSKVHYSNEYSYLSGAKITQEMAFFLKGTH